MSKLNLPWRYDKETGIIWGTIWNVKGEKILDEISIAEDVDDYVAMRIINCVEKITEFEDLNKLLKRRLPNEQKIGGQND
jgi:hypothetical protein